MEKRYAEDAIDDGGAGTVAPAFELMDVVSGKAVGRDDAASERKGLLVMFICVHCPYVKHVEQELARIGKDYEEKIGIVAISSNDIATHPRMRRKR